MIRLKNRVQPALCYINCVSYLCQCGSSCSPCCVPLSHLTLWPPAPHQGSVPTNCDLMTARCPVDLEGKHKKSLKSLKHIAISESIFNFCESSSTLPGQFAKVSTYVWFLQCVLWGMVNLTHCCCDWMTSELPPVKEKGKGCRALVPSKTKTPTKCYRNKTSLKLWLIQKNNDFAITFTLRSQISNICLLTKTV